MQGLIQTRKVINEERKQAILGALADKYCRQILHNTLEKPKSAMEISRENNIPISTVYRRLQALYDAKLLTIFGSISQDGKKYFLYKNRVRQISVKYDLEAISLNLTVGISNRE